MPDARDLEVSIEGLRVFARHGALPEEQRLGQRFVIDVAVAPLSDAACDSDDVADAVDYGALAARVVEVASGGPYALLERLADAIAVALLEGFAVGEVSVRVAKPGAPVPAIIDTAAVTVTRRRA
jgi:dihydroneopterin aldolase